MVSLNAVASSSILNNLRQINRDLLTTQERIGTGKRVNSAADNANIWSIAQGIRNDIKGQEGASSTMAIAKSRADTASAAIDTVTDLLNQIKAVADDALASSTASSAAGFFTPYNAKVTALKAQITATLASAGFQGENWLTDADANKTVTIGMTGGTAHTVAISTVDQNETTDTIGVFNAIPTMTNQTTATNLSNGATTAVTALTNYQATLKTFAGALETQIDFQKTIRSIRESALSALVDADMEEESARVTALQTKQQLAYQALAIGNSSAANILSLFR